MTVHRHGVFSSRVSALGNYGDVLALFWETFLSIAKVVYYLGRILLSPYAARFYDCCGAEDPDAAGCATGFHLSYDDPE